MIKVTTEYRASGKLPWCQICGTHESKTINYDTLEQAAATRKAGEEKYYKPILEKYKNGENL